VTLLSGARLFPPKNPAVMQWQYDWSILSPPKKEVRRLGGFKNSKTIHLNLNEPIIEHGILIGVSILRYLLIGYMCR
jgi:hypothetical protein